MNSKKTIIEVKNLTKKFNKNITAVNDISFDVKEGEIFAFLGPNGAGKTTTIRMLTTMLSPTSGSMLVNSFSPVKNKHEVRSSFGIVFQDPSLDNELTAQENLEFHAALYNVPKSVSKKRIPQLLKLVGLSNRKNDFIKNFSGGMKRRLEIARGFLHHPKILFLDEPTLGLDPQTRNQMWKYVSQLNKKQKMTVFLTTHYMEEAENVAQQIAIIDHGKIIAIGSPKNLKAKTKTSSLEKAFLKLTGHSIRKEEANIKDRARIQARSWGR
jgi:ABC-2 type transport system ATP-binding protein